MNKLKQIKQLYPEERIEKRKKELLSAWNFQNINYIPFVFNYVPSVEQDNVPDMDFYKDNICQSLETQLDIIIARSSVEDYCIPSLFPGLRQGTIPCLFGCKETWEESHYWVHSLINDPSDVYKLKKPDISVGSIAWRILENIKYFRKETKGQLPIQMCDMQGPLDIASHVWGYQNFLSALYTNPDEVHHLLKLVTETFIDFVKLQIEAAEGDLIPIHCPPVAWMPLEKGISFSEDLMATVSPQLYEEFAIPYDNLVAEEFKGLVLHSCGDISHNLKNILKIKKIMGLNFGDTETELDIVVKELGNKIFLIPHASTTACKFSMSQEEHIKLCMETFKSYNISGEIIITPANAKDTNGLNELALTESKITKQ